MLLKHPRHTNPSVAPSPIYLKNATKSSPENAEARWVAQGCLYLSLDWGLRLAHPLMPFVTEELWQRCVGCGGFTLVHTSFLLPIELMSLYPLIQINHLNSLPGRGSMGEAQSIMLAPYPTGVEAWKDPEAESRMAAVKDTIHAARSLRAQYGLTPQVGSHRMSRTEREATPHTPFLLTNTA